MDKFDRIQLLHRQFRSHRYPISITQLAERLECTEKTVKRAIENMRDYLGAPIEYESKQKGWHYTNEGDLYELPGLWLTSSELQSLALLIHLTEQVGQGMLRDELTVIDQHIEKLLNARDIPRSAFDQHIKVLPLTSRYMTNQTFASVCEGLLHRNQLNIRYCDYSGQTSNRTISPQTLVYYRENWYLDAWCHLRKGLRTFSVARIERITVESTDAKVVPQQNLEEHFSKGYGIFAGTPERTARLRFFPTVAREVAMQRWHPEQRGEWDGPDYVLTVPYSDDRELLQDVLRYVPDVVVEKPGVLRDKVRQRLYAGLERFDGA